MPFEGFPFVVGWELTLDCNLRCRHCASSAGTHRGGELTLDESLAICDQFPALLVQEVIFTGGEPLLSPNWFAIASRLKVLGIQAGIVTNGTVVSDDVVGQLVDCGITAAGVSIDGPEAVHDSMRGHAGCFRKASQAVQRLVKGNVATTVITSVTSLNIDLLDEVYELVKSLGAWKWQLQPIFPLGRAYTNSELHLGENEFIRLGKYIYDSIEKKNTNRPVIVPADSCGFCSDLDREEFGWHGCPAGRYECGIMSDGRVKGCLSWPDSTVEGDLREADLWTIWFEPGAFSRLRGYTADDVSGSCKGCEQAQECGGGCQAMSLSATGTWHADPLCYRRLLETSPGGKGKIPGSAGPSQTIRIT
jgi:radical SAM protein with 4Fe4S-binding SPASM domain